MLPQSTYKKIETFFDLMVGRRHLYIQTHDVPDPDALAAAEAFRLIAKHYGHRGRIVVNGMPQRRENLGLIKECRIELIPFDAVKVLFPRRSAWVYIDCQPSGGNITMHPSAPGDLYMVVDHHAKKRPHKTREGIHAFYIHDQHAGATSSMVAEILFELKIPFPPRLASALAYGITTDTMDFIRGATLDDLHVYGRLLPMTNQKLLARIRNISKPRDYFVTMHRALENAEYYRHLSWAWIGEVNGGEIVAEIADSLLSIERITWSLALGHRDDRLFLSMRSANPKARCGILIRKIVPYSRNTVGGHGQFAGGYIPLREGSTPEDIVREIIGTFLHRILRLRVNAPAPEGTRLIPE